ncbi:hypothetical protein D3C72_1451230 [compost metagenome]
MLDAEGLGDRRGHEAVGSRHHRAQVARLQVLVDQRLGLRGDDGVDHLAHEALAPGVQPVARIGGQRGQREAQERLDIQGARLVLPIELVVLATIGFLVDNAHADQEAAPFVVAVGGDQGVVEVKQCQIHGRRFYIKVRMAVGAPWRARTNLERISCQLRRGFAVYSRNSANISRSSGRVTARLRSSE